VSFCFRSALPGLFCISYRFQTDRTPALEMFKDKETDMEGVVKQLRLTLRHSEFDEKGNAVGKFPAHHKNSNFSMRFDGFLAVGRKGKYTFYVSADDQAALYINQEQVARKQNEGSVSLEPGLHDLCLAYSQGTWGFGLKVEYEGPGIPRQEIPAEVLFHAK
jgi:hypothetical protein